jgi:hypothetical protein
MRNQEFITHVFEDINVKSKNVPNLNEEDDQDLFTFTDYVGIQECLESIASLESEEEVEEIADHRYEPYEELDHSAVQVERFREDGKFWCGVSVNLKPLSDTESTTLAKTVGDAIQESFRR